jgi:hypothetical protein
MGKISAKLQDAIAVRVSLTGRFALSVSVRTQGLTRVRSAAEILQELQQ